ncbi:integral peroxisomal membrane peroxin-domain-containing protein [Pisolithus croceorrhizus]|nr:integral peroxisomal membrane peroxin-domain-containing protein [Pisolithus croceorrhizus]
MATFEYVDIPPEAIRLASCPQEGNVVRPAHKIPTTFPDPSTASGFFSWHLHVDSASPENGAAPSGPSKTALTIIPQLLLSSSLPAAAASAAASASSSTGLSLFTSSPRSGQSSQTLLSTRDPLSFPIVTSNFRRFVARVGPVFWLQDRIEEIILWKKGWKRTVVWLAAYGFICYFPRLILLLPHALLLGVMLTCYPAPGSPPVPLKVNEGTADWQANIQAIQNLMGAFSDAHDTIVPLLSFLGPAKLRPSTTRTPSYSPHPALMLTVISFLILLPVVMADILPLRLLFFLLGAGSVCALHPNRRYLHFQVTQKKVRAVLRRFVDDDRLSDNVWPAPMCTVELWENERWEPTSRAALSGGRRAKTHLRRSERAPWTRGRDGWSGVGGEISSNLTFSLSPGWAFVETESWRADLEGTWVLEGQHSDSKQSNVETQHGWVYTTDTWSNPRPNPCLAEGWVTRRRRWIRRVYWKGL